MSFAEVHAAHPWDEVLGSVAAKTEADVLRALARAEADSADLEDFKALISPAAAPHLERMARLSHERTLRRYGRTMQLFAPAYLSNECQNICTYCGFSAGNKVPRRTLNPGEILREAGALKKLGFDHLLLVLGHDERGLGVVQHVDQLRSDRILVDRHRDAAQRLGGELGKVELRAVVAHHGELVAALEADADDLPAALAAQDVAVVALSHVDYRTSARLDMAIYL